MSSRYNRYVFASAVLAAPFCASSADAQTAAAPTREEIQRNQLPQVDQNRSPRLTVEGSVERAPCPLADPRYANISVTFSSVTFANLKAVDPASLDDSWREFAGKPVPIATVCEIRDRAATTLRRQGFLAAVQVLPQRIEDNGSVQFDVLMAKLVSIQVRGDAGPSERLVARYLEKIKDQPVFNSKDAERSLLLARDLPGYDVRLTLRPAGTVPGEIVGEVAVTHQRFQVDVNVQNYGGHDVGRFGGLIRAQVNDLTGMGDSTTASIFNTADLREQTVLQVGHSFFVGDNGLRLSGDFTYAWTRPTLVPTSPIRSRTLVGSFSAAYPFVRRQSTNVVGAVGFELVNQRVEFGPTTLTNDKARIAYARVDFDRIDPDSLASSTGYSANEPRWRYGGSVEVRQGISIFGASKKCGAGFVNCLPPFAPLSRIEARPAATVLRGSAYVEFRPVPNIAFSLAPRAQYSASPLLSYEEFSAGNYTIGRGFDPGSLLGDSGLGVQAEVRFGSLQPKNGKAIALQPFAFFDMARVWNQDRFTPPYAPGRSNLFSTGGGVRAAWGNHSRLDLTAAKSLSKSGLLTSRGDTRILLSLTTKLIPWRL
jgi:hemolysin activation/secretion protein